MRHRRRSSGWLAMETALAFGLVACSSAMETIPSHGLSTAEASRSATSEPTFVASAGPSLAAGWTEVASFGRETSWVAGVAHGSEGFIAVGSENDGTSSPNRQRGRVWLSPDGLKWELLAADPVFDLATLADVVIAPDGGYLIFGPISDASGGPYAAPNAAWESIDGRAWRRIELGLPADMPQPVHVVAGARGYLLSSTDQLWFSPDARQWDLVYETPSNSQIQRIAAGAEGFVASGLGDFRRYIIASADGQAWFDAPPQPALDQEGTAPIAALGGDWIMPDLAENDEVPIWFSADGLNWHQSATVATDSGGWAAYLVGAGGHLFLTLAYPVGSEEVILPIGVWDSTDGTSWQSIGLKANIVAAAASEDLVVLAGNLPAPDNVPRLWVSKLAD